MKPAFCSGSDSLSKLQPRRTMNRTLLKIRFHTVVPNLGRAPDRDLRPSKSLPGSGAPAAGGESELATGFSAP